MRQRAALARAFIAQPQTMLMDEPFGALDALTRLSLQDVLRQLIAQERPTVLLVTHDVDEALFLADRIVVFSARPARVLREFNLAHRVKSHIRPGRREARDPAAAGHLGRRGQRACRHGAGRLRRAVAQFFPYAVHQAGPRLNRNPWSTR